MEFQGASAAVSSAARMSKSIRQRKWALQTTAVDRRKNIQTHKHTIAFNDKPLLTATALELTSLAAEPPDLTFVAGTVALVLA